MWDADRLKNQFLMISARYTPLPDKYRHSFVVEARHVDILLICLQRLVPCSASLGREGGVAATSPGFTTTRPKVRMVRYRFYPSGGTMPNCCKKPR